MQTQSWDGAGPTHSRKQALSYKPDLAPIPLSVLIVKLGWRLTAKFARLYREGDPGREMPHTFSPSLTNSVKAKL